MAGLETDILCVPNSSPSTGVLTPLSSCCMPQLPPGSRPSSATSEEASNDSSRPKKHVSFRADKDLVRVREIPRREDSPLSQELEPCNPDRLIEDWGSMYGTVGAVHVEHTRKPAPVDLTLSSEVSKSKKNHVMGKTIAYSSRKSQRASADGGENSRKDSGSPERKSSSGRSKNRNLSRSRTGDHPHCHPIHRASSASRKASSSDPRHRVTSSLLPLEGSHARHIMLENGRKVKVVPNMTNKGLIEMLSNNKHRSLSGGSDSLDKSTKNKTHVTVVNGVNGSLPAMTNDAQSSNVTFPRVHSSPYRQSSSASNGKLSVFSPSQMATSSDSLSSSSISYYPRQEIQSSDPRTGRTVVNIVNGSRDSHTVSPQSWPSRPSSEGDVQTCTRRLYAWHMANNSCTPTPDTPCISQLWEGTVGPS